MAESGEETRRTSRRTRDGIFEIVPEGEAGQEPANTALDAVENALLSALHTIQTLDDPEEGILSPAPVSSERRDLYLKTAAELIDNARLELNSALPPDEQDSMPITVSRTEKTRMSLDLTPELKAAVDDLAARSGTSRSDVLRQAILLLRTLKDAEKEGLLPALIDHKANVKARLVGV